MLSKLDDSDQIVVVCDGADNTPDIVMSFGDRVELVTSLTRLGKGGAILTGFQHCRNEIVGFVDADNAVPADDVFKLASMVSKDETRVMGSRWVRSSKILKNEPFFNVLAGRVFHYTVYFILGLKIKDTQRGAKFFHRDLLKEITSRKR